MSCAGVVRALDDITRVKAGDGHPGTLVITYPREMSAATAKQLDIPFTKVNYGMAQLTPSIFIQELGSAAPRPSRWSALGEQSGAYVAMK
jgi:hypothetical protein